VSEDQNQLDKGLPIVVIGAGIIGLMTAYALVRRGYRVTVIDRLPAPAEMCSRANAGIVAAGHAQAWAEPKAIVSILRALIGREPSVRVTKFWDPELWRWGIEFLRNCTSSAHHSNSQKLQKLSLFSSDLFKHIESDMGLIKETRHEGGLYLFRDADQFNAHVASLTDHGDLKIQVLDRAELLAREPALADMEDHYLGGFFSQVDAVGDCHQFANRTHDYLLQTGQVDFLFNTAVTGFSRRKSSIDALITDQGTISCDQLVLATGVETADITAPLGFKPIIYPVKGYSGTWKIVDGSSLPRLPYVDETEFLAVGNYGDRLRVTATVEFAGRDSSLPEDRIALIDNYVRRNFGAAVDLDNAEFWTGMRPTTPQTAPYLGRVRHIPNLWINAGHGQLGWTMSSGCGEIIAQLISGTTPTLSGLSAQARWLDPA
jgi:D-amino-acid dehydrogenase